jgi:GTP-binding protein
LDQAASVQCFSSLKNTGLDELKAQLQTWLAPDTNNDAAIENSLPQ